MTHDQFFHALLGPCRVWLMDFGDSALGSTDSVDDIVGRAESHNFIRSYRQSAHSERVMVMRHTLLCVLDCR